MKWYLYAFAIHLIIQGTSAVIMKLFNFGKSPWKREANDSDNPKAQSQSVGQTAPWHFTKPKGASTTPPTLRWPHRVLQPLYRWRGLKWNVHDSNFSPIGRRTKPLHLLLLPGEGGHFCFSLWRSTDANYFSIPTEVWDTGVCLWVTMLQ